MPNPDEIDKQNVASLNARENSSRFPPVIQIIGYQTVRPSVPVVVWAFPSCVITWYHNINYFPAGMSSRQDIPVLPAQTNKTCRANKETQPKGNTAENPSVQVNELFLLLCQVQYILLSCFLIHCHTSKKYFYDCQ